MTADLKELLVRVGPEREMTMAELLAGWAAHVDRFRREAVADADDVSDSWGAHDLLAALSLRDLISWGSRSTDPATAAEINGAARAADQDYIDLTAPDDRRVVRRFAGRVPAEGDWWWDRIPAVGPARDEFERWIVSTAGS